MQYVYLTMTVPAALRDQCNALSFAAAGEAGRDVWSTGLSATGNAPATHYISSGPISDDMAALLPCTTVDSEGVASTSPGQPAAVPALAAKAGITTTLEQIKALYASIDVSDQDPFAAMARLGLQIVRVTLP